MMRQHVRPMLRVMMLSVFALMSVLWVSVAAAEPEMAQDSRFNTPVVVVNTSFLNVRTGPGTEYPVLITVVGGTTLPVLGIAPDRVWFQVSTQAGPGWINSQFGLPRGNFQFVPEVQRPPVPTFTAPPSFDGGTGGAGSDDGADVGFASGRQWGLSITVTHDLRNVAGLGGINIGQVGPNNVIYAVTGAATAEGVAWVQIDVPGLGRGWVEQSKATFRPYGCGFSVVRMTQSRDLSVGPDGTGGDKDKSIAGGQEAYLLDERGDLFKIELINGSTGWVDRSAVVIRDERSVTAPACSRAVSPDSGSAGGDDDTGTGGGAAENPLRPSGPHVVVNTGFLNIRSGAGAQYSVVASVAGGTRLSVTGFAPDGVWIQVAGDFGRGWVNNEFVLFRGNPSAVPVIRDTAGDSALPLASLNRSVTLYAAPNLTLGIVANLNAPAEFTVIGRTGDGLWVQLTTPSGIGWVQADFVTVRGGFALVPVIGN